MSAQDDTEALDQLAECLRSEEWTQGRIEAVAAVVASVRDVTSRNRYTVNDERRTGANIEPGQDWDFR